MENLNPEQIHRRIMHPDDDCIQILVQSSDVVTVTDTDN